MKKNNFGYPSEYMRVNNYSIEYFEITIEYFYILKDLYKNIEDFPYRYDEKSTELLHQFNKNIAKVIVFAEMSIEALINDHLAASIGDDFFYNYFDKMSIDSKIMLIAKFIFGVEIRKDSKLYSCLKLLIRERNRLVHNKSYDLIKFAKLKGISLSSDANEIELTDDDFCINLKELKEEISVCKQAIQAIVEVATFLDDYDENIKAIVKLFKIGANTMRTPHYMGKAIKEFNIKVKRK